MNTVSNKPLAAPCKYCAQPVIRDSNGTWVHTSLQYSCVDRWGLVLSTYAAPAPERVRR